MKTNQLNLAAAASAAALALSLFMAGCGSSGSSSSAAGGSAASGNKSGNVSIGLVASLTGPQKPWGEDSMKGAELALEDFNKAGGIPGVTIKLDIQDSQSTPQGAGNAAAKLISDGVAGIVGEVSSGNTIEIAHRAINASPKIPVVAIGATKTSLTDLGDNIFRVCYKDSFQGGVMATFAYQELGFRKMAVLTDNKLPYSQGLSGDFIKTFTALGGKICDQEMYETGASSFTTQLTNIKASNPDAVFASGYFTEVGPIVAAAHQMGLDVKFLGGDGWDSPKILTSGGSAILGDYFCNHYTNMDQSPAVQNFLKEYKAKYGSYPGTTMAALGYDAMNVTLDALKRSKSLSPADLTDAIANTDGFKGVSGVITLKGNHGTPNKRALVVEIVKPTDLGFQKPVVAYQPGPDGNPQKVDLGGAAAQ